MRRCGQDKRFPQKDSAVICAVADLVTAEQFSVAPPRLFASCLPEVARAFSDLPAMPPEADAPALVDESDPPALAE